MNGFERTTFVVISTDCTGSCKSNYRTIAITTPPTPPNKAIQRFKQNINILNIIKKINVLVRLVFN